MFFTLLGMMALGGLGGVAVGGLLDALTDDDIETEAHNHTGGYDLSSQYSEIKRIYREKGNGYYDIGLSQYMKSDNRYIDSWEMKAKSADNLYVGKKLYYD